MNTTELTNEIARRSKVTRTRLSRREVSAVLDLLLDVMAEELSQPEGKVILTNFATLSVEPGQRSGGQLRSGEQLRDQALGETYHWLRFRASRALTARLRHQAET